MYGVRMIEVVAEILQLKLWLNKTPAPMFVPIYRIVNKCPIALDSCFVWIFETRVLMAKTNIDIFCSAIVTIDSYFRQDRVMFV